MGTLFPGICYNVNTAIDKPFVINNGVYLLYSTTTSSPLYVVARNRTQNNIAGYYGISHEGSWYFILFGSTTSFGELDSFRVLDNASGQVGSGSFVPEVFDGVTVSPLFNTSISGFGSLTLADYITNDDVFTSRSAFASAVSSGIRYPITYQNVNCELSGPSEAAVGDSVSVVVTHGTNFTVSTSDVYVTNNGVSVPFTYANGTIAFTMPNPST